MKNDPSAGVATLLAAVLWAMAIFLSVVQWLS